MSIAWKIWSYPASWRAKHEPKLAMSPEKDVSPEYKEAQRKLRCYFSGVSQHRVVREYFSSFRSTLHISSQMMLENVWNWSLLRRKGEMHNWVRLQSYYLNLCEAHGLHTWGQLLHLMNNGRKFSTMRRTSCPSFVQGFIDSFFMLYVTYVSNIVIARQLKIILSSNNTKW